MEIMTKFACSTKTTAKCILWESTLHATLSLISSTVMPNFWAVTRNLRRIHGNLDSFLSKCKQHPTLHLLRIVLTMDVERLYHAYPYLKESNGGTNFPEPKGIQMDNDISEQKHKKIETTKQKYANIALRWWRCACYQTLKGMRTFFQNYRVFHSKCYLLKFR